MNAKILIVCSLVGMSIGLFAEPSAAECWRTDRMENPPAFRDCPFADSRAPGMKALLVNGFGPNGTAAEFFCYYALPDGERPANGFPGVLLVHGGGGTAYPNYVEFWRKKGFAVLAPDWYNSRPMAGANPNCLTEEMYPPKVSTPLAGGRRNDIKANVANLYLASSLLRAMPEVDKPKTVYVGLSWGSWYGATLAALDDRFNGYVEIYCGDRNPARGNLVDGRFLAQAKKPMWWIVWTNDKNVTPPSSQSGFDMCPQYAGCALLTELRHSHVGFTFDSVARMARHFASGETGLPRLGKPRLEGSRVVADILSRGKTTGRATLNYTAEGGDGKWHDRKWQTVPATVEAGRVTAELPADARTIFLSLYEKDEGSRHDLCGSSGYFFHK